MTTLSKNNWNLPPDRRWEFISELAIYGAPLLMAVIMPLPISETLKLWLCFPFTLIVAVAKILAKLTKEMKDSTN